ncbi:FecR family protein [Sphingobacterium faecale]|uniref:FecR domain-containing protein n=1 Tax=Sphingobacterium faecale TaxID=2803775 RepID=A0ABS1R1A5_9SPHI|nr:FecR domain-containing protein [Sphingobacterium faecale]MBL1408255.1 FecR domain-containing protein [Sphingobacterium faecale]
MEARIHYLLRQYFYNRSTRSELDELFTVISSAKQDEEISLLIKELYEELKEQDPSLAYVDYQGKLLESTGSIDTHHLLSSDSERKSSNRLIKTYVGIAISAAILLVGFFYTQRWRDNNIPKENITIVNNVLQDDNKVLVLDDGTRVWVNSSSKLEYPRKFKKGQPREVTLVGEAYFEVERAKDWPFIVHTGDVKTKVVGTKFNVKAYPGMKDVLVTVKTGKVMVSKDNTILATLVQNQELRVPLLPVGVFPTLKEKALKSKVAGSWTEGYLEYEDESIAAIIADIERFYQISIKLHDPVLGNKIITTSIPKNSTPTDVLEILTTLTDTHLKKEENNYIIF